MNIILSVIIPAIIGASIGVGAAVLSASDIIDASWSASNLANQHQIRNALEIYYLDHNNYPQVANAGALFDLLKDEEYIKNKPLNPEDFSYSPQGAEDYEFKITGKQ